MFMKAINPFPWTSKIIVFASLGDQEGSFGMITDSEEKKSLFSF